MTVKLTEVVRVTDHHRTPNSNTAWKKRDIFVNPEHVVYIRSVDLTTSERILESLGSPSVSELSIISLNRGTAGVDIMVEGSVGDINTAISSERRVIHG